jgi:MFS family permease
MSDRTLTGKSTKQRPFYGWVIVATLGMVNFATAATGTLNLGLFIIPMSESLEISRGVFGWLSTARTLSSGVSSAFLGGLVDRFGARLLLPLASLITGLCLLGLAASSHVYQAILLFCVMGLVGLGSQAGSLLSSVPVAKWFVLKRGRALSFTILGQGIGPMVFVPVSQILISGVGWRMAWVVLACTSMVIIIPLTLVFIRRQPEDMGMKPDGGALSDGKGAAGAALQHDTEEQWTLREAVRTRTFWQLAMALMLGGFAMGNTIYRIPYWTERGFDPQIVSWAFSVDAASAAAMGLATGFLVERLPPRFITAAAYAGFAGAVVLMLFATNVSFMFLSTILFGCSAGVNMVAQIYLWANYYGRASLGTIRGVTMPITLLATAAGAPIAGYIYDFTGGFELAWQMTIAVYVLAVVIMLTATPPKRPRQAVAR